MEKADFFFEFCELLVQVYDLSWFCILAQCFYVTILSLLYHHLLLHHLHHKHININNEISLKKEEKKLTAFC